MTTYTARQSSEQQPSVRSKAQLDAWLDQALADTFPASDPVASPPAGSALVENDRQAQNESAGDAPNTRRRSRP